MGTGKRTSSTNPGSVRRHSSALLGDGRRRLSRPRNSEAMKLSWPLISAVAGRVWVVRETYESGEVINGQPGVQIVSANAELRRGTPGVRGCVATAELVPDQHGLPAVLKIRHPTRSGERSSLIFWATQSTLVQTYGSYRGHVPRRFCGIRRSDTTVGWGRHSTTRN